MKKTSLSAGRSGQGSSVQHKIGSETSPATPDQIKEYENEQKDTLSKPTEATQDIFTNHLVEILPLMGDETIGDIEDLKWIEGLFSIATGIPQALLSGGRETATKLHGDQGNRRRTISVSLVI